MADWQGRRFQVFLQEKEGVPHQDVGSVHAPDVEMALLNARDVFVRRPHCISLWVVPVEEIFSKTQEELQTWQPPEQHPGDLETYLVFCKRRSAGTAVHIGEVEAGSPATALREAFERFPMEPPPFTWWVFPAGMVVQSDPEDAAPLFLPAEDKPFRQSSYYHVLTEMRQAREAQDAGN
jgi:ring-1,2-phenylacetyl-CoA epoxidase subunit PaaB